MKKIYVLVRNSVKSRAKWLSKFKPGDYHGRDWSNKPVKKLDIDRVSIFKESDKEVEWRDNLCKFFDFVEVEVVPEHLRLKK